MAATLASVCSVPLISVLLLFELTKDYRILLPLMVGDGSSDHYCWQRPKDITTSKRAYKIKEANPGSEVARETTAALAAALMVFKKLNPHYLSLLLCHVEELLEFGDKYKDRYDKSMEVAKGHYPSISGYGDERLWATLWLHRATGSGMNLEYVTKNVYSFSGAGGLFPSSAGKSSMLVFSFLLPRRQVYLED